MATQPHKISMRGLAEVVSAKPSSKQSRLKRFKFPDSEESVGRSNYYVKALSAIRRHHKGDASFVDSLLSELLAQAAVEKDALKRAKLINNYQAITNYLKNFGARKLVIKPGTHLYYLHKDLLVSAHPDLVAEEDGRLILIKLHLGREQLPGGVSGIMLHVLYEAAIERGLPIESTSVECLQSSSGLRTTGPKGGFPGKAVLNNACQELSSLWPAA